MYLLTAVGITVGYHRLLTHRSFQTPKPVEYAFAVLGSMAVQGPVIAWVADHRKHHAHTDVEGDPHSPHVGHGDGVRGVLAGLWHAHTGWLLSSQGRADWKRYAPDLYEDPGMRCDQPALRPAGRARPRAPGARRLPAHRHARRRRHGPALGRPGPDLLRPPRHLERQLVCHFLGTRRFEIDDHSTNVFWLALPSLGESWHHNHHAFPRSAVHGLRRWELDPSALIIAAMEKLGLAWNVVRISPERQAQQSRLVTHPPVNRIGCALCNATPDVQVTVTVDCATLRSGGVRRRKLMGRKEHNAQHQQRTRRGTRPGQEAPRRARRGAQAPRARARRARRQSCRTAGRRAAVARKARHESDRHGKKGARRRRRRGGTRADQAVALIQKNPGITASEIAKTMKIKPNYLYRVLGDLEKEGRVKKKGRTYSAPVA